MIRTLLLTFILLPFISCDNAKEAQMETWIGGEIINPKTDHVILLKDNVPFDTVKLDDRNFFKYNCKKLKQGLYSFQHSEFQVFFLEPGDSIMLRVNTVDFDESLTYSGRGAEKNNFLMELFLNNEAERKTITSWYTLTPKVYEMKLDSMREIRNSIYNEFNSTYDPSEEFKRVAKANIEYAYNANKELYVSINHPRFINPEEDYPKGFFDYRKDINFGDKDLQSYYPYYRFLDWYFDNLSFQKYKEKKYLDRKSFIHNYNKIKIIDSFITNDTLRNRMLRSVARRYFVHAKDASHEQQMLDLFLKLNTNEDDRKEIVALAEATMKLTPGNKIPNVLLVNTDNMMKDLQSVINKPTVIYFWSTGSIKHFKTIHTRVAELQDKYPEFDFTGINTDTHFKKWRDVVRKSGYNKQFEFQLEDLEKAEAALVINSANKAIIVDKDGTILEGNTNLFNSLIEAQLLGILNK
ncbi:TlpA family protein disulfide reductase [Constantimarinum furrinae]|uniref:TlpA family protein disulfide reductase n=1 Tax=Constantimarinum furrinae TaxID=2562285 RepID=UPI00164BD9A1|nr:thioredoxin-like domain-containing protein [Constantimarinum furrinae]